MKKLEKIFLTLALVFLVACQGGQASSQSALAPMVRVGGETYVSTGYVNSMVTCGTASGQISSSVPSSQEPQEDNQSNFGKGYDWQTWQEGYINVKIDDKWVLFQNIAMDSNLIPEGVAHFKGKVLEAEEDQLLVQVTEIDDAFFFYKKIFTKPLVLSIENLKNAKDGYVTTEGLEGKEVEVWFDGQVSNYEEESSGPIELGDIYKIDPVKL